VLSHIFLMVFFPDSCVITDIPDGIFSTLF
jgi:hypothetical protein